MRTTRVAPGRENKCVTILYYIKCFLYVVYIYIIQVAPTMGRESRARAYIALRAPLARAVYILLYVPR